MRVVGPFTPSSPAEAAAIMRDYLAAVDGRAPSRPLPIRDVPALQPQGPTLAITLGSNRRRRPFRSFVWSDEAAPQPAAPSGYTAPGAAAPVRLGPSSPSSPPPPQGSATAPGVATAARPPEFYATTKNTPTPRGQQFAIANRDREIYWWALALGADDWALWALTECGNDDSPALIGVKPS